MGSFFSKSPPPAPPSKPVPEVAKLTSLQQAKFDMKVRRDKLERISKQHLKEQKVSEQRMREAMQEGDVLLARRMGALSIIKRKLREATLGNLMNLETLLSSLQTAEMNRDQLAAMAAGTREINSLLVSLEEAESIRAEASESIAQVDRLSAALGAPLHSSPEAAAELEAELTRLMGPAGGAAQQPAAAAAPPPLQIPAHVEDVAVTRSRAAAAAAPALVPA